MLITKANAVMRWNWVRLVGVAGAALVGITSLLSFGQLVAGVPATSTPERERTITLAVYRDKMRGAWLGQMIGVGWGDPTEFKSPSAIIPVDKVPVWKPQMINQQGNDDVYFNIEKLMEIDQVGIGLSQKEAMIAWLNRVGRHSGISYQGRMGLAPPDSCHPRHQGKWFYANLHMYPDWAGIISPGLPRRAADLMARYTFKAFETQYDGQFMAALYAAAFLESDPRKLLETGLQVIPAGSQYAEAIRDVLRWHEEDPKDWEKTWRQVQKKYFENPDYLHGLDPGPGTCDAKVHGAYVAMGLLYGEGDLAKSIVITMRCGQDSDCSASNTGGLLGTILGESKIPASYKEALDVDQPCREGNWNLQQTFEGSERLARRVVEATGGRIEGSGARETFRVRDLAWSPGPYARWWDAPLVGSNFSDEEMHRINVVALNWALPKLLAGWEAVNCDFNSGLAWTHQGRKDVVIVEQKNKNAPAVLKRSLAVPAQDPDAMRLAIGGDKPWQFEIRVNGRVAVTDEAGKNLGTYWKEVTLDLAPWRGQTIQMELSAAVPQLVAQNPKKKQDKVIPPDMCVAGLVVSAEVKP